MPDMIKSLPNHDRKNSFMDRTEIKIDKFRKLNVGKV